jgi:predicted class III extradiol MEMO1 family dioxygenase
MEIKKIAASVLLVSALAGCSYGDDFIGVIVPHHLLVEDQMNAFYDHIWQDFDRVVVLSPNHFDYGFSYIQTNNKDYANELVVYEPERFNEDHGVTVHYDFILDRNPSAEIFAIKIKETTPLNRLDDLVEYISSLKNTLVVASIDFTHAEYEAVGIQNDQATLNYIEDWSRTGEQDYQEILNLADGIGDGIGIDSPETFYVILEILNKKEARDMELYARTSTVTELGYDSPEAYTSHLFLSFD